MPPLLARARVRADDRAACRRRRALRSALRPAGANRVFVCRAGQVRLVLEAEQVFERVQRQRGGGRRYIGERLVHRRSLARRCAHVGRRKACALKGTPERVPIGSAFGFGERDRITSIRPRRRLTDPVAPVDIGPVPPTGDRWEIVSRRHRYGRARPVSGRYESAVLLGTLEPQHAHAQNAVAREAFAQPVGHRAQVFADHDRTVPARFERDDAQQVRQRVTQIGAVRCPRAFGNEPEPLQPENVIDAQAA